MPAGITLDSLVAAPVWVGWQTEKRNGKATKVPYGPRTHQRAKSDDPNTWATRAESDTWAAAHSGRGVGIMFGRADGDVHLAGIDLDSCRDPNTGAIADWAQTVLDRFRSYSEVSPSQCGIKVFFYHPPGRSAGG
jgi:putative DNA primase/helicase